MRVWRIDELDASYFENQVSNLIDTPGLHLLGMVNLGPEPQFDNFSRWLSDGKNAGMAFLENNQHCRKNPKFLGDNLKSALIFAKSYFLGDQVHALSQNNFPAVAQYARTRDYHKTLRKELEQLGQRILEAGLVTEEEQFRVFVDSAPVLERALAARTGSGFIGKNTLFIQADSGSFYFLAGIGLSIDFPKQRVAPSPIGRTATGGCGSCKRCQVYCPTGALDQDYQLDARKCLAYYSIEHRGTVPIQYWPYFRLYFFGCDICQLVCPYNRGIKNTSETSAVRFNGREMDLLSIATMNEAEYVKWFGGTPLTRAKRDGLRRNAFICLAALNDERVEELSILWKGDPSVLLRETAQQLEEFRKMKKPKRLLGGDI